MKSEGLSDRPALLERALGGDAEAVRALFSGQRERLKRLVRLRLRRDLAGQVDESKVVDEILSEAAERLAEYAGETARPVALWLRERACRKLADLHGRLLGIPGRDAEATALGELTLHAGGLPVVDAASLAARILGETVESRALDRAERRVSLQEALNSLEPVHREMIALKHFERLGFCEIAQVLGMTEAEAGRRYLDAIRRLRDVLPWDGRFRGS